MSIAGPVSYLVLCRMRDNYGSSSTRRGVVKKVRPRVDMTTTPGANIPHDRQTMYNGSEK